MSTEIVQRDLITKMVALNEKIEFGTSNEIEKSYTVDLVANVGQIDLMIDATLSGNDLNPTEDQLMQFIKSIYIEPDSKLVAVNITGADAFQLMRSKKPGKNYFISDNKTRVKALLQFDFTDYMRKMNLALPASSKSIIIKIELDKSKITNGADQSLESSNITLRLVQDKALECNGYRRYYTQSVIVPKAYLDKEFTINLPRSGLLDSFYLKPTDFEFSEILLEKDDETYPLKSSYSLEQMVAQLNNDELFSEGWLYCDLMRPIMAEAAKSLKLKIKVTSFASGKDNGDLHILYEYVNFGV